MKKRSGLEVHTHSIISGPNARKTWLNKIEHSHEGGDTPHVHDDGVHGTGPGALTIDKDEWYAATGLRGGGRKVFTKKPSGPQMPFVRTEPCMIEIIVVGDGGASIAKGAMGAGLLPAERMKQVFGAQIASVTHVPSGGGRAA